MDNDELTKEVLDEEILTIIKDMAINKSPRLDGFTIEFFQI